MVLPEVSLQDTSIPSSRTAKRVSIDWPELPTSSRYVRRTGWEHRPIPEELTRFPDDFTIPKKLQQILTWSLIPGNNWSYQQPKKGAKPAASNSEQDKCPQITGIVGDHKDLVQTARSSIETASMSSYSTTLSQPVPTNQELLSSNDKSLKTRLLLKMRLTKSNERLQIPIPANVPATAECTSCFDDLPEAEMTRLDPCRHWYCKGCLSTLITTAMATETSFPPKCCLSPIPLQQILRALTGQQREAYQLKAAEYAVTTTERWYCPNKDCLKWIPASKLKINKELGYDCPHCASKLCRICRGPAHPSSSECPQDFGLEATLETAEIEGWQRCYKCQALVEHNRGCRHMTCRCRAQFCYVCGQRWQTCNCTETDAANKRAGAERRRQEKIAKVDTEAAEIARAIAEVEEMERREAEERRLEEERQEMEEQQQLLALEAMRLEEELQRQEAAAQAEREFRDVLLRSSEEEWDQMEQVYLRILAYQSELLNSRHEAEDLSLRHRALEREEHVRLESSRLSDLLARNSRRRRCRLVEKQKADLEALKSRQEEDEDDLFLQVQMRLRGKANKESRMERMLNEIHKQQEDERGELAEKQQAESKDLDGKIEVDAEGLRRWRDTRIQDTNSTQVVALQKLGFMVGADRQYFDVVFERRRTMISMHGQACLDSLRAGEELVGLTEFAASKVEPYLPELDAGEAGPSGIDRGPQVIPTAGDTVEANSHTRPLVGSFPSSSERTSASQQRNQSLSTDQIMPIQGRQPTLRPPIPAGLPLDTTKLERKDSPIRLQTQSLTPPNVALDPAQFGAAQSKHQDQRTQTANSALAQASVAAGIAWGIIPNSGNITTQEQGNEMGKPPVVRIAPSNMQGKIQDRPRVDKSAQAAKKSKWGFRKTKEVSEDEMKRMLKAAVGDAF